MSRLQNQAFQCFVIFGLLVVLNVSGEVASAAEGLPAFAQVRQTVEQYFSKQPNYKSGDIISRGEVRSIFSELGTLGWKVEDQEKILEDVLEEGNIVVRTLRTRNGRHFMRKVEGDRLIYDRLDRVSRASGGRKLIEDIVKLPDGYRYAKSKRPRAVPGLLDLLPKKNNGLTREIRDYNKPTGRIYTQDQLIERLQKSYDAAKESS